VKAEVLRFADVTLRRGQKHILDQVNWQVREGQHWIVLGPNGAGKTTALQIAAARLHPTSGQVWVLGQRLGRVDVFDLRGRIGLATATLAGRIPPGELVRDTVMTAAYGVTGRWHEDYGLPDQERAQELLDDFGVGDLTERYFASLSEGETKRVLLARALMADPEVLLLDEPTAGLDVSGREQLLSTLSSLASQAGSAIMILVTHHVEEIPPGFTHAALMRDGRFIHAGPISQVLTSAKVSEAFGLDLSLHKWGQRYSATAN